MTRPRPGKRESGAALAALDRDMKRFYRDNRAYFEHMREAHDLGYFDALMCALRRVSYLQPGSRVLDIGSGSGSLATVLRHLYGATVSHWSIDISFLGCQMQPRGYVINGDAKHLPIRSNVFDLVVLNDVLEHIPEPQTAFMEAYRVVAPAGLLWIRTPNYRCPLLAEHPVRELADLLWSRGKRATLSTVRPRKPNLSAGVIGGDEDACSAVLADGVRNSARSLDAIVRVYETWAGMGWRVPILRVLNHVPYLRHLGGTCSILLQKPGPDGDHALHSIATTLPSLTTTPEERAVSPE